MTDYPQDPDIISFEANMAYCTECGIHFAYIGNLELHKNWHKSYSTKRGSEYIQIEYRESDGLFLFNGRFIGKVVYESDSKDFAFIPFSEEGVNIYALEFICEKLKELNNLKNK